MKWVRTKVRADAWQLSHDPRVNQSVDMPDGTRVTIMPDGHADLMLAVVRQVAAGNRKLAGVHLKQVCKALLAEIDGASKEVGRG